MKEILVLATLLIGNIVNGQSSDVVITFGLYGTYADPSWYQELTINENGTFLFLDRVELGDSHKYEGQWRIERNKLVLYNFNNNNMSPISTKYIISNDQLCSKGKGKSCFKLQNRE